MFIDDVDPENEDTTTDDAEDTTGDDSATDDNSQQSDDSEGSDDERDWKASYKGLQRASEKKRLELEEQLEKANTNLQTTTQMLESEKGDAGVLEKKQKDAEEAKTKLEDDVQKLQTEHDKLQKQIDQQNLVMDEFPHLAPVAKFIPVSDDNESYRKGAEELSKAITSMVDKGVETSLSGSSATFEEGDDKELESSDELDAAWDVVYETAGDPEKQKEYDEAFAKIEASGQTPEL